MEAPSPVQIETHAFDVEFHPHGQTTNHLFASCHVSGQIRLWKLDNISNTYSTIGKLNHHRKSCRVVRFFPDGERMISGSSDHRAVIVDINGQIIWRTSSDGSPVNVICIMDEKLFASGDDDGCLKIWDSRMNSSKPAVEYREYGEYISDIQYDTLNHPHFLVATSGDCLGVFDIRMAKPELEAMSDPQETDLLCCRIVKDGKKVICGTDNGGFISVFDWGDFGDMKYRIPGHGISVDQMVVLPTENDRTVIITGAGDGLIRIVGLFPGKVLGSLGGHNDAEEPIELLALSPNKQLLVSGSLDNSLRFYSTSSIFEMIVKSTVSHSPSSVPHMPTDEFFSDISLLDTIQFAQPRTRIALGSELIPGVNSESTSWSVAFWGPHVSKAWVSLSDDSKSQKEIELHKIEGKQDEWGGILSGLPSLNELEQGKIKYHFILESSWNDCYKSEGHRLSRRDPYARQVDFESNLAYFLNAESEWKMLDKRSSLVMKKFDVPTWDKLIIYELHCGTFVSENDAQKYNGSFFEAIIPRLEYIRDMGFTAIELMPVQQYGGIWGYNPRVCGAIHDLFGTARQLRRLVSRCHDLGLAVIFDLVLNHGSVKLNSLWNWDGYGKEGGIYFEGGGQTTWGTKFAFHKREVRDMLKAAARRFAEEFRANGLRLDSCHNMPDDFLQELTSDLHHCYPGQILIAEVTPENPRYIKCIEFNSCWIHANYYDILKASSRKILRHVENQHHIEMIKAMVQGHKGFAKAHNMIASSLGSHDQIGNRHPHGHSDDNRIGRYFIEQVGGRDNWDGRAQCRMWYALMVTSRPIPMIFMGSETLQMGWWDPARRHIFQWNLVDQKDLHASCMMAMVKTVNELRITFPELREDNDGVDIVHEDRQNKVIAFVRFTQALSSTSNGISHTRQMGQVLIVLNASSTQFEELHTGCAYKVQTRWTKGMKAVQAFNSQASEFGGWNDSWTTQKWQEKIDALNTKPQYIEITEHQTLNLRILPKYSLSVFVTL